MFLKVIGSIDQTDLTCTLIDHDFTLSKRDVKHTAEVYVISDGFASVLFVFVGLWILQREDRIIQSNRVLSKSVTDMTFVSYSGGFLNLKSYCTHHSPWSKGSLIIRIYSITPFWLNKIFNVVRWNKRLTQNKGSRCCLSLSQEVRHHAVYTGFSLPDHVQNKFVRRERRDNAILKKVIEAASTCVTLRILFALYTIHKYLALYIWLHSRIFS